MVGLRMRYRAGTVLALALAVWAATAGAAAGPAAVPAVERGRWLMGTLCTISAEAPDTAQAAKAIDVAFGAIARLEKVMSGWRDDSELARLNSRTGGEEFPCSPDLFAALVAARDLAAETGGAFDPTVEPFIRAWDLRGEGRVPTAAELDKARDVVGYLGLQLDRPRRIASFARTGMAVDLGGIGKGIALDRAAEALRAGGVRRALLNFGGEILAAGEGDPRELAVADPADRLRPAVLLKLAPGALSTSAQSERGFERDGVRYGHVLDPRSGQPLATRASVSVVAASSARADALATALLVMGRQTAAAWAMEHRDVGVLWLEPAGEGVRAWTWNLEGVTAAPGARVEWMRAPTTSRGGVR